VLVDLAEEHAALDAVVADLDEAGWNALTPAPGWRVRDQIGHLAYFDQMALLSAVDPDGFEVHLGKVMADLAAFEEEATSIGRSSSAADLLEVWRGGRQAMLTALADVPDGERLLWYGPPMSARSFATARLMETWAHGQDVVDALGTVRAESDRIRHICHLGVATFSWSWRVRGEEPPAPQGSVRVELELPSGAGWSSGPEDAADVVRGPALDFCLVVTQRRNVAATALAVVGPVATSWMQVAQCFAGSPTTGPPPPT
jgi:uncharacterized protein (TIGR03084 family)